MESEFQSNPVAGLPEAEHDGYQPMDLSKKPRLGENLIQGFLFFCGALSILTTIGIVYVLVSQSLDFFRVQLWENTNKVVVADLDETTNEFIAAESGRNLEVGETIRLSEEVMEIIAIDGTTVAVVRGLQDSEIVAHDAGVEIFAADRVSLIEFFTNTEWNPQIGEFGILPLITATLTTSTIALLVAMPLGLAIAIYLSEYASPRARNTLKPILEVLAGIPTVVYGYFALTLMTPILRSIFGQDTVQIYNTASAGIVVGILILPLVSSMSEDALSSVPGSLREAAYALGGTRLETALRVMVPAAFSGIMAAFILAWSRALGETMIVAIAAGAGPAFTANPFEAAETMTGHIVRISGGDLSYDSIDYNSIFAIALVLFAITLMFNIVSQRVVRRYREVYE